VARALPPTGDLPQPIYLREADVTPPPATP